MIALKERQRSVLDLREERQMTYREIGDLLNLTPERIRQIYLKAAYERARQRYMNELKAIRRSPAFPIPNTHILSQRQDSWTTIQEDTFLPPDVRDWILPPVQERKLIRQRVGISGQQLAVIVGVTRASISRWETGERNPQGDNQRTYGRVLREMQEAIQHAKPREALT